MSVPADQMMNAPDLGQLTGGNPLESIQSDLPEVDTSIDPTQFASSPDVQTAETVQSDVSLIDPPQDINAAEIGEYTPYTDVQGQVNDESTVEGRLNGLLSQDSNYIKRARTGAAQTANRRGMLNSSMAAGAGEGAAIDRALPIAQQDAASFLKQQFINQGYSNDAAKYLADQSVQRENLEAGLDQDTNQFNQSNTLENQRLNAAAENQSSSDFANATNVAANNATREENKNNFAVLSADLQGQLAGIDNALATNLQSMVSQFNIMENLDSINGSIYQQLIAEVGSILANTDDPNEARVKVNALIESAGVEFEFSSGEAINPQTTEAPPAPEPTGNNLGGGGGGESGNNFTGGSWGGGGGGGGNNGNTGSGESGDPGNSGPGNSESGGPGGV